MKPTQELLDALTGAAMGEDIAYVDLARRRFKGEAGFDVEKNSRWLGEVDPEFEELFAREGWQAVLSLKNIARHPKSAGVFFCSGVLGLGLDAAASAIGWLHDKTGFGKPKSTLGLLESISAGLNGKPVATVKVPKEHGGWDRHSFQIVAYPEIMRAVGMGIEFIPRNKKHRPRLRPLSPPSTLENINIGRRIRNLSANEIALIVTAHSQNKDFAGQWEKKRLPDTHNGMKCLSQRLAGLYVHSETKEGILVFRGTQPSSLADWIVNLKTTHGEQSYQHRQSIATVEAAKKECSALMLAGHSKGGGIAQYAACVTGTPAVTFNSVGLATSLVKELSGPRIPAIDHFMTRYDVVSNVTGKYDADSMGVAGPGAFRKGERQPLIGREENFHFLPPPKSRFRVCSLHSMESIQESMAENPYIFRAPTSPCRPPAVAVGAVTYLDGVKTPEYEFHPPMNTTFDRELAEEQSEFKKPKEQKEYYRFKKVSEMVSKNGGKQKNGYI